MEGGENNSVYEDDESSMMNDVDDVVDDINDELTEVMDDEVGSNVIEAEPTLTTTIEDYLEDPKQIFALMEPMDLKNKERTLIERRQNGYYRDKDIRKIAYEIIVKVYVPYITRENLLMPNHP